MTFVEQETTEVRHRIRCTWSAFAKHRQEPTVQSYLLGHRLHLFHAVVTPTITYGAGTWATTEEHEKCSALHSTECFDSSSRQRENTNKTKKETGGKDIRMFPAPHVTVGVTTGPKRCNRSPSKLDWNVGSCRCLANSDQAHRILCHTSVVSCSTNVIICSKKQYSSPGKYLDMHLVEFDFDLWHPVCFLVRYDFGLYGWISSPWAFVLLSKSAIIF